MEGAEPRHSFHRLANHGADAVLHLARGLVGESDGQDVTRTRPPDREDVGNARGQHPRLAGPGARKHEHGPIERFDRLDLLRVQALDIVGCKRRPRARGNAARAGHGRGEVIVLFERIGHGALSRICVRTKWHRPRAFARGG